LENERQKLFGTYTERQRVAQIHPLADKFHLGEKRQINLKVCASICFKPMTKNNTENNYSIILFTKKKSVQYFNMVSIFT